MVTATMTIISNPQTTGLTLDVGKIDLDKEGADVLSDAYGFCINSRDSQVFKNRSDEQHGKIISLNLAKR